ncbi:MAG TPA: hypothetical protein VGH43_12095 [Jatrophihabitans sp.]
MDEPTTTDRPPGPIRAAVVLIVVEALALVAAAVVLVVKTITGDPNDIWRALLGAALAVAGAAALAFGARALQRLRPAARSPIVVLQLLALPVSYSLWFQAGRVGYGAPIMIAALAVLFLLFTPPARAALDREVTR